MKMLIIQIFQSSIESYTVSSPLARILYSAFSAAGTNHYNYVVILFCQVPLIAMWTGAVRNETFLQDLNTRPVMGIKPHTFSSQVQQPIYSATNFHILSFETKCNALSIQPHAYAPIITAGCTEATHNKKLMTHDHETTHYRRWELNPRPLDLESIT